MVMQRDFVGYGNNPPKVEWPRGARLAINLAVSYQEGGERCIAFGDPVSEHLGMDGEGPETAISRIGKGERDLYIEGLFGYGSTTGFWRLIDIFDTYEVKVTFFCVGKALEMNPEAGRAITAHGHEAASHGYRWIAQRELSREEEKEHLRRNVETIQRLTGKRPVGQRTYGASLHTRELLVEEGGFIYDADFLADDLPWFTTVKRKRWLLIPYTQSATDERYMRTSGFVEPEQFFIYLKENFDRLYKESAKVPKMMPVGLHLRVSGLPSRANTVERFIQYAKSHPGVWFARYDEIAKVWLEQFG